MRLAVVLAVSVTASGCLAHTARERRDRGGVVLATGAAMVAGGVLLAMHGEQEEDLLLALPEVFAGGMIATAGSGFVAVGGFNVLSSFDRAPVSDRPVPPSDSTEQRMAACATWRSNRDAEHEPARIAALDAARPAHCR